MSKTKYLDKVLDEIATLETARRLLETIYTEIGPYKNGKLTDETWHKVKDFFEFDDSE